MNIIETITENECNALAISYAFMIFSQIWYIIIHKINVKFLKHFLVCLFIIAGTIAGSIIGALLVLVIIAMIAMGLIRDTSEDSENVKRARKHSSRVG